MINNNFNSKLRFNRLNLKFGNLIIKLAGQYNFIEPIEKELKPMSVYTKDNRDDIESIKVNIMSSLNLQHKYRKNYGCKKIFGLNDNALLYPKFKIKVCKDEIHVIIDENKFKYPNTIEYNIKDRLVNTFWKFYDRTYINRLETLTYTLINNVLEPIILYLYPNAISLVHAAGISYNGYGFLISGSGGAGKTTTALKLLFRHDDFRYVTDDISFINNYGEIIFYPRKLMIYPYNFSDLPYLQKYLDNLDVINKLHWKLHLIKDKDRGARRRISPFDLFPEHKIETNPVKLHTIFFIEKTADTKKLIIKNEDINFYVQRIYKIMRFEEYNSFGRGFLTNEEIWKNIYIKTLKNRLKYNNTKITRVIIPKNTHYEALEELIYNLILEKSTTT